MKQRGNPFATMSADAYDQNNEPLRAISAHLHFLVEVVLKGLPEKARILSVGAGTGLEIEYLGRANPKWTFTAVEPAASMLAGCRKRMAEAGLEDRCQLIEGHLAELQDNGQYDAVLCLLVLHFIHDEQERQGLTEQMIGKSGVGPPVQFVQSLMIRGWFATKP